jgi:nicotinate-nucleotide adenylyltransferase
MKERVGIFGGTFDPPHLAHLAVARAACDHLDLDRLLWIPAGRPPHKEGAHLTDAHHRTELTRLMTDEDVRFRMELGEVMQDGISWTVDTLERIRHAQPDWVLVLIMGQDQWASFDSWQRPDTIRQLAELAVYRRQEGVPDDSDAQNQPDHWLPGQYLPEASTRIRERIRQGHSVDDVLTPDVVAYIQKHGLYS